MSESTQQLGVTWSSLMSILPRPQVVTGFFKDYMTRHFQEGNIENPELQKLIWRDGERTNILIETSTRWAPQTTGLRPAVVIHGNDSDSIRLGIADRHQGMTSDGNKVFTTFWSSSTTLFCIGETGAQAAVLASEVQRQLTGYQEEIRCVMELMRFRVLKVGGIYELAEYAQNFVCPVTAGYFYTESWESGPEAPRLSKVTLSLSNFIEI
jgi:hypothetical protein